MKRLLLLFNPLSGQEEFIHYLFAVVDKFTKAGYDVTAHPTQFKRDAYEYTLRCATAYDCLVCSGGDGTLREVVDALMLLPVKPLLGYIPSGTTNDFASSLGLPGDIPLAADLICDGNALAIDIGHFQQEYFTYVAAFGLFTDVSYDTPQGMKNILGHAAYMLEGVKRLANIKYHNCEIRCNGETFSGDFVFGLVTNSPSVGGFKLPIEEPSKSGGGAFKLILLKKVRRFSELQQVVAALMDPAKTCDSFIVRPVQELHISSAEPLGWTLDGEYGGDHSDVDIGVVRQAVKIFAPADTPAEA